MRIGRNTRIISGERSEAVLRAAKNLERDVKACCLEPENGAAGDEICLEDGELEEERYALQVREGKLVIRAGSDLGFIFSGRIRPSL